MVHAQSWRGIAVDIMMLGRSLVLGDESSRWEGGDLKVAGVKEIESVERTSHAYSCEKTC